MFDVFILLIDNFTQSCICNYCAVCSKCWCNCKKVLS